MKLNKIVQQKEKCPREGTHVRVSLTWTLRNIINTKLEAIMQEQRSWCRPVQALGMLLYSLWVRMSFAHVDLDNLAFLASSISVGLAAFLPPLLWSSWTLMWGACLKLLPPLRTLRCLTLWVISGYGSLYLFPSADGGSFTDDGWTRQKSMSIPKYSEKKCSDNFVNFSYWDLRNNMWVTIVTLISIAYQLQGTWYCKHIVERPFFLNNDLIKSLSSIHNNLFIFIPSHIMPFLLFFDLHLLKPLLEDTVL